MTAIRPSRSIANPSEAPTGGFANSSPSATRLELGDVTLDVVELVRVLFVGRDRSERTVTEQQVFARLALARTPGLADRAGWRVRSGSDR